MLRWCLERMIEELRETAAGRFSGRATPRLHDAGSGACKKVRRTRGDL
jgi:hypothetical protein